MATKKKKKKSQKMPSVPSYQAPQVTEPREVNVPNEPMSLNDYLGRMPEIVRSYLSLQPEINAADIARQKALMQSAFEEQERQLPISAANRAALDTQWMPHYTALYGQELNKANPEFMPTYSQLGAKVREGLAGTDEISRKVSQGLAGEDIVSRAAYQDLADGRKLGEGLTREVQQGIRGAQAARGNWLGAAPTAQEAFGIGGAAEALYADRLSRAGDVYNTRLGQASSLYDARVGQAQNFMQGRQPTDMWGALQAARPAGQTIAPIYPSQNYIGEASGAFGTVNQGINAYNATSVDAQSSYNAAMGNYNNALISSASNAAQFGFEGYDRSLDQWLYKESVKQGLYTTPSYSSGGGGMNAQLGMGIGTAVGGLATAGVAAAGGGAALAGAAGAAISAAGAAICWLARKCLGDRWKEWQAYLFTEAPESLRKTYIYKAKRVAAAISDSDAARIKFLMERILA